MSILIEVFCCIYINKLKRLRVHSVTLIISDAARFLSIHINCSLPLGKMSTLKLPKNRFQNFYGISKYNKKNYRCLLDEDIYVNGRQGSRQNWMWITVHSIRTFYKTINDIILENHNYQYRITHKYINPIVIRFLETSDSHQKV